MKRLPRTLSPVPCLLISACLLLLSGCVATHWKSAEGDELRRISVGGDQSAASVNLKKGTMEGYKSEQAQIAGAVAGEVAKALAKP
jgi:hypothetical protein